MMTLTTNYSGITGGLLYAWLGSFWTMLCEDAELVRDIQKGNGILAAKMYQEFAECLHLSDRNNSYIYHNNIVHPLQLSLSDRDAGTGATISMDMVPTPCIGPQVSEEFIEGEILKIGGNITITGTHRYDIDADVAKITTIVDNIENPTVIYVNGVNFIISDNTLVFINDSDPFDTDSIIKTPVYGPEGVEDYTVTLYCYDMLIDRKYLYNYFGYVFGYRNETSEEYQIAINRMWDVCNYGSVKNKLLMAAAAILGEPFIKEPVEKVIKLLTTGSFKQVVTDHNVYTVPDTSTLRNNVIEGAELPGGSLITTTLTLYENIDLDKRLVDGVRNDDFMNDVLGMFLGASMFSASMNYGIGLNFETTDIIHAGFDLNGNALFTFKLYGNDNDIKSFWDGIKLYCETNNVAMATFLSNELDASYVNKKGSICGRIRPLKYFMCNMFKANMYILTVNNFTLTTFGKTNAFALGKLKDMVPADSLMVILNKITISDDYDVENLCEDGYNNDTDASELVLTNYLETSAGGRVKTHRYNGGLTYGELPVKFHWFTKC